MPKTKPIDRLDKTRYETTYDLTMFEPGGSAIEDIELSRDEFTALKERLAGLRDIPNVQSETASARFDRIKAYEREAASILTNCCGSHGAFAARFSKLTETDMIRVLALVDLFSYWDHGDYCQIEDLPNWLGVLLADILEEVAAAGPEEINAHPETIKQLFDRAMYEVFDSLSLYRRVVNKLPFSIVDEMAKRGEPKPPA